MKKRILPILLALIMALTLLPTLAMADEPANKVLIDGNNEMFTSLEAAVKAANPGNTIYVYPGNYDIVPDNSTYVEGQTGWYLAITKSLTIMGVDADGNPITDAADACANIYSTYYTANGAHASQDLIYVNADDVTISGLNIMNKYEANKAIEVKANNFKISACNFMPITEELFPEGGIGSYSYDEWKDYGATLYFNGSCTGAVVENNNFDRSRIAFDSAEEAEIEIKNNTFEGVQVGDDDYVYYTVGYTSWSNPQVFDISGAEFTISGNKFIETGKVDFSKVTNGSVDVSGNYWEGMNFASDITGPVTASTIYADASMTKTIDVVIDGTGENTLKAKIDAADPGAEIDLGGKYYPENLSINKSITLKNGTIDTATAMGVTDLTFEKITFVNASTEKNLDTNPAALYLQNVKDVDVIECSFVAPANATGTTVGITTGTTEDVRIEGCKISGYTITAYHNPDTSSVVYAGNEISNVQSGIAFIGSKNVDVLNNTFTNANGIRVEPSWIGGAVCEDVVIENNSFINTPKDGYAVRVQNSSGEAGYEGALKLNENYWGTDDPADIFALIKGDALVENYYPKADMDPDSLVELDTNLVYTSEQLIEAIADAKEDAVITLAPGTYDGNIRFDGKSLTIKAQYPANPESGNSPTRDQQSKFTGTFNTSEGTGDDAFQEDQCVIIDGIAFKGDGLKVGNNNYNTVGELIVKNCTMECGKNLEKADVVNYNQYNYFVKVSGNAGAPYAKVTVNNNKVTGTPENDVYTIQLWDVFVANVSENLIYLTDAPAGHQAINISKMAENATVIVEDNVIVNATGGIYVTTWLLGGTGDCAFTGDIDVVGNVMDVTGTPIYIGWEESAAPYGSLGANCSITDEGNYNGSAPVVAEVVQKPGEAPVTYVVTVKDGQSIVDMRSVVAGSEYKLPAAPSKPGYIFMGWKCSDGRTHQANETVTVEKDMTFTAVWSNLPDIEPGEPDEPDVPDFPFTDVSVNAWYYEAVKYVYENGIMNGMDRYSFQPNGTLTRAMVWTMLARLDGVDTEGGNSWYAKAQEWATANGVSDGENPTGEVTREQLVTMLYRYAQYKGYDVSIGEDTNILSYVDVDQVSDWAMEAFQWACGTGVIEGDENSALTPKASTTRAQAAAMFMRFIEL